MLYGGNVLLLSYSLPRQKQSPTFTKTKYVVPALIIRHLNGHMKKKMAAYLKTAKKRKTAKLWNLLLMIYERSSDN